LQCIDIGECVLRREKDQPVMGYAVALQKPVNAIAPVP
jgi:hypothetical protein